MKYILLLLLISTQSLALPLGLKGRVQLGQEVNRDVDNQQTFKESETDTYFHLLKGWKIKKDYSFDLKLSGTSTYRFDLGEFQDTAYRFDIGFNF